MIAKHIFILSFIFVNTLSTFTFSFDDIAYSHDGEVKVFDPLRWEINTTDEDNKGRRTSIYKLKEKGKKENVQRYRYIKRRFTKDQTESLTNIETNVRKTHPFVLWPFSLLSKKHTETNIHHIEYNNKAIISATDCNQIGKAECFTLTTESCKDIIQNIQFSREHSHKPYAETLTELYKGIDHCSKLSKAPHDSIISNLKEAENRAKLKIYELNSELNKETYIHLDKYDYNILSKSLKNRFDEIPLVRVLSLCRDFYLISDDLEDTIKADYYHSKD